MKKQSWLKCRKSQKVATNLSSDFFIETKSLFKVLHSGLEQLDIILAGDVFVQAGADSLAVAHLAQDSAVGGRDALNGVQGAVGVEVDIGGGVAVQVNVLGGDLTVCRQLCDKLNSAIANIFHLMSKAVATVLVLIWNYVARKKLLYK